ncbi:hypothetical protein FHU38_005001 [Saccharomonospora amisosensis]|uniref:Glycosyltransferase RgtA/B/C/D-like domain-containing protein n=1 Tax=Saccharomonospora amisosensis TaxID=1128677 RepID=A0A7X5UUZ3_9PSEU|nr:hypothetical protein [Saccharomonospora amisosensis]NIJ14600.1 hypothetical protein [Saccharomonospora amisosensis]
MTADRVRLAAVVAALGAVFAVGTWAAWDFVIDDAFITFRYSANLADGYGPVWNVGQDPVEGFTNFGWMLWLSAFAAMGLDLVVVAKVTSLLLGIGVLVMLLHHARRSSGLVAAVVAGACFAVFLPTYFHLGSGLETMAFAAVVLRATIVGLDTLAGREVRPWEPPLLLLLAGLLRPEGVLAVLPAFAVWLWQRRGNREALLWTSLAAAVGVAYFAWRWSFYGQLLPNTFYMKFGNLDSGSRWLEHTVAMLGPLALLTAVLLSRRSTRAVGALLLGVVAATYATYAVSGPTMDYVHRFAFHAFPVLCLGAGLAVGSLGRRWAYAVAGVGIVAWTALAGVVPRDLPTIVNYGEDLRRAHVAIGQGLARADVPEAERTLAVSDAGAIPYYSRWDSIDYIGLNDEAIARGGDRTAIVRQAHPTVIVVTSTSPLLPNTAYGLRVREVTTGYLHVAQIKMRDGYWQNVFVVPEWATQVAAAVTHSTEEAMRGHDPGRYDKTLGRWLDRLRGRA